MARDSTLVQRGLLLLALLAALAVTLFLVWRHPDQPVRADRTRPEWFASMVASPQAGFPATVAWAPLVQLAQALPSPPGFEIRYTATRVLAHRGSPKVRLDMLAEMLDEDRQLRNFRATLKDGTNVPNEVDAHQTIVSALNAVREWHKYPKAVQAVGRDNPDLHKIYRAVDRLAQSSNRVLHARATETRLAIEDRGSTRED